MKDSCNIELFLDQYLLTPLFLVWWIMFLYFACLPPHFCRGLLKLTFGALSFSIALLLESDGSSGVPAVRQTFLFCKTLWIWIWYSHFREHFIWRAVNKDDVILCRCNNPFHMICTVISNVHVISINLRLCTWIWGLFCCYLVFMAQRVKYQQWFFRIWFVWFYFLVVFLFFPSGFSDSAFTRQTFTWESKDFCCIQTDSNKRFPVRVHFRIHHL